MQSEQDRFSTATDARGDRESGSDGSGVSDASIQAALASLAGKMSAQKPPRPGELKWKLTSMVLPSVMLIFVALYVTGLSAGTAPEVALFQAGGVSVVLAVLGRVAVSILGDDSRLLLNVDQLDPLSPTPLDRDDISDIDGAHSAAGAEPPSSSAPVAGSGGKE